MVLLIGKPLLLFCLCIIGCVFPFPILSFPCRLPFPAKLPFACSFCSFTPPVLLPFSSLLRQQFDSTDAGGRGGELQAHMRTVNISYLWWKETQRAVHIQIGLDVWHLYRALISLKTLVAAKKKKKAMRLTAPDTRNPFNVTFANRKCLPKRCERACYMVKLNRRTTIAGKMH